MLKAVLGDITRTKADVIVNAANSTLLGGGGVDGAIHRAGGPAILQECMKIRESQGGCPPGEAVITTAGRLPAKFVIHTVGPVWHGGMRNEDQVLAKAYTSSLMLAVRNGARSVAFPNISTGIYGFPKERAAKTAVTTVREFLKNDNSLDEVLFVCFDSENYEIYERLLNV
ncbi:O-acetyl-ADP-ribose deacetylase [bacterium]|nr:O-acetyl-ADP-ribose deacetylase [bacterium]